MTEENKAIFLDRDGVIIHDVNYLSSLEQICFYDDVAEGLKRLKKAGYLLIIVTNQSGVARGFFDEAFVMETHQEINRYLQQSGSEIDAFYYCPHHVAGKPPYNLKCACRKPETGMVLQAKKEMEINLKNSFMLGDKISDIELAENAGLKGILLKTGQGIDHEEKVQSKYPQIPIYESFSEAVTAILSYVQ